MWPSVVPVLFWCGSVCAGSWMHLAAWTVNSSGCRDKAIAGSRDSDLAGLTLEERNGFLLGE